MEIRVHGVGRHGPTSALGRPRLIHEGRAGEVYAPPLVPDHPLQLVNWSRTSRKWSGFWWCLAVPFTLVNVAGEMGPLAGAVRRRVHAGAVMLAGLLITVMTAVGLMVVVETIFLRIGRSTTLGMGATSAVVSAVAGVHVLRRRRGLARALGLVHVVIAAAVVVSVLIWAPARRGRAWPTWLPRECDLLTDDGQACAPGHHVADLPSTVLGLGVLGLLLLGVIAWLAARGGSTDRSVRVRNANGSGTLLTLGIAGSFVVMGSGLIRLGIDWLLVYLRGYPAIGRAFCQPRTVRSLQLVDGLEQQVVQEVCRARSAPVLKPFDAPAIKIFRYDVLAVYPVLALACLALVVVAWRFLLVGRSGSDRRSAWHRLVIGLPRSLGWQIAAAAVVTVASGWLIHRIALRSDRTGGLAYAATVVLLHGGAAFAVLFIAFSRLMSRTRTAFSLAADVLGFWPARLHPFAGRSYRDPVVEEIGVLVAEVDASERVRLVGHSQGSVLCSWVASRVLADDAAKRVDLVTCGCPLGTLYASFFPATFDREFFAATARRVRSWRNYWRLTDPIASPLPDPDERFHLAEGAIDDVELPDDAPKPLGHSDYWIDPTMVADLKEPPVGSVR